MLRSGTIQLLHASNGHLGILLSLFLTLLYGIASLYNIQQFLNGFLCFISLEEQGHELLVVPEMVDY